MNVIGDIAGQYKALIALVDKMPKDEIVLVGDLVDRGPQSKEVIEWAMKNATVVCGNHEHMMVDFLEETSAYDNGLWLMNGGVATLDSYGMTPKDHGDPENCKKFIPKEHIEWLKDLPLYIKRGEFLVSHAPVSRIGLDFACSNLMNPEISIFWNRFEPIEIENIIQITGHNAHWGYRKFFNGACIDPYAYSIDTSHAGKLTGINTETLQIFEQGFI